MKQLHAENELSGEVLAMLADFDAPNFEVDDNLIDDAFLDEFIEDRFGGEFD